jgi:hypothetical protein
MCEEQLWLHKQLTEMTTGAELSADITIPCVNMLMTRAAKQNEGND